MRRYLAFLAIILFTPFFVSARNVNITGRIADASSLQPLQGASVYFTDRSAWCISGVDGSFTLAAAPSAQEKVLVVSYMGYVPQRYRISIARDTSLGTLRMVQDNTLLPEASVYARRHDFGVRNSQMSAIEVPVADIKGMPSLFGEIDVCVLPLLAADGQFYRLGYGGGYYDRFLSGFEGATACLVLEQMLFDALPREEKGIIS